MIWRSRVATTPRSSRSMHFIAALSRTINVKRRALKCGVCSYACILATLLGHAGFTSVGTTRGQRAIIFVVVSVQYFFEKGTLFWEQGRSTGIRITGSAFSVPGAGFVRPSVCPTISSTYGWASGGQLTDCLHQMSSYDQYILFICCIVCCMSSVQIFMSPPVVLLSFTSPFALLRWQIDSNTTDRIKEKNLDGLWFCPVLSSGFMTFVQNTTPGIHMVLAEAEKLGAIDNQLWSASVCAINEIKHRWIWLLLGWETVQLLPECCY